MMYGVSEDFDIVDLRLLDVQVYILGGVDDEVRAGLNMALITFGSGIAFLYAHSANWLDDRN